MLCETPQNGDQALWVSARGSRQPGCGPRPCQMREGDRGKAPDTPCSPGCTGRDPQLLRTQLPAIPLRTPLPHLHLHGTPKQTACNLNTKFT